MTPACDPVAGGLVVGNVYDLQTGAPLNDATVTVDAAPEATTTSGPTPEDDQPRRRVLPVVLADDRADRHHRRQGPVQPDRPRPSTLWPTAWSSRTSCSARANSRWTPTRSRPRSAMGESTDLTLTISNVGTGSTEFEIRERNRGREILARRWPGDRSAVGRAQFSERVAPGPASVQSAGPRPPDSDRSRRRRRPTGRAWRRCRPGIVRYAYAQCEDEPDVLLRDRRRGRRDHCQHQLPLRRRRPTPGRRSRPMPDRPGGPDRGMLRRAAST